MKSCTLKITIFVMPFVFMMAIRASWTRAPLTRLVVRSAFHTAYDKIPRLFFPIGAAAALRSRQVMFSPGPNTGQYQFIHGSKVAAVDLFAHNALRFRADIDGHSGTSSLLSFSE
jgi:hypothetical protein